MHIYLFFMLILNINFILPSELPLSRNKDVKMFFLFAVDPCFSVWFKIVHEKIFSVIQSIYYGKRGNVIGRVADGHADNEYQFYLDVK
jgi:hypothetical protein